MPNILVVEGVPEFTDPLVEALVNHGKLTVCKAIDRIQACAFFEQTSFEFIITDIAEEDPGRWELLDIVKTRFPDTKCIIFTCRPNVKDSVEAIKRGAFDYVDATSGCEDALSLIEKTFRDGNSGISESDENQTDRRLPLNINFIGKSPAIVNVIKTIQKVAHTDNTVLITGESGTGKELIARAIHENSHRRFKPLVVINCGAIPGELLESELFGHEKGAFTGAHRSRIGRFELAHEGSIFLDEIGDMSPDLQVKLLRVIQEQTFERVGSTKSIRVDIRIIAATNKNLIHSIQEGNFREDLFYRLNVIPIHVPPLRERKTDIPLLIEHFMRRMNGRRSRDLKPKVFSSEALNALERYDWPGNIRELENLIARLSVLVEEDVIQRLDLPEKIQGNLPSEPVWDGPVLHDYGLCFNDAVEKYQRDLILQALNQANWVKAKAAEMLQMNRTTLVEKIKKMKLEPEQEINIHKEMF